MVDMQKHVNVKDSVVRQVASESACAHSVLQKKNKLDAIGNTQHNASNTGCVAQYAHGKETVPISTSSVTRIGWMSTISTTCGRRRLPLAGKLRLRLDCERCFEVSEEDCIKKR